MFNLTQVGAVQSGEAFLLLTGEKSVLVDSGYSFCADQAIENVKRELNGRPLDYLILTHSHYDHISGCPYFRSFWSGMKIVGSEYIKKVLSKPSAIAAMRRMNDEAAQRLRGIERYDDRLDELTIDIAVHEGSVIDLGGATLRVIETPGHTQCSVAYYCAEESLLISSETLGTLSEHPPVVPSYLIGYDMTIASIRKAAQYAPKYILVPHNGLIGPERSGRYFEESLYWTEQVKEFVIQGYLHGKTADEIVDALKNWIYTGEYGRIHPLNAYLLNTRHLVSSTLRECLGVTAWPK